MEIHDASGRSLKLRSLLGKPLLINLWATWCAPCIAELPMLDRVAVERAENMKVLAVSQDMSRTEKVGPFLAQNGAPHLGPWIDPETDLTFALGAQTLPTTVLYDAAGKEIWRYIGGRDWTSTASAELLDEAARPAAQ